MYQNPNYINSLLAICEMALRFGQKSNIAKTYHILTPRSKNGFSQKLFCSKFFI